MITLKELLEDDWRQAYQALLTVDHLPFWIRSMFTVSVGHSARDSLLAGTLLVKLSKARLRSTDLKLNIGIMPKKLSHKDIQIITKIMAEELATVKRQEDTGFFIRKDLSTPFGRRYDETKN